MVSPTQLCWRYQSLPLSQRYMYFHVYIFATGSLYHASYSGLAPIHRCCYSWTTVPGKDCCLELVSSLTPELGIYVSLNRPQIHKSHNASLSYPTMHHSEQKCTHFCYDWCIVVYGTGATFLFWMVHCGIWDRCIVVFVRLVYWVVIDNYESLLSMICHNIIQTTVDQSEWGVN